MKQRTITFLIILIAFLSIFSVNYEVFTMIKSSKLVQSRILVPVEENKTTTESDLCCNRDASLTIFGKAVTGKFLIRL